MLAHSRRDAILQTVMSTGQAKVGDLAERLEVSEMTIRRDLNHLASERLVEKVHGGAILPRRQPREPHFVATRRVQAGAKTAIAQAAVKLVREDMTIALSAGTTTWLVAKQLRGFRDLRFVTNSINVALVLEEGGWDSILVAGGLFRTPSDALVGSFAEQTLRQLNTDLLFLGAHSVDVAVGLTTPNVAEAETNSVLVANTREVVLIVDSTKLGRISLATFATLADVDVLITDSGTDDKTLERLRGAVPRVVVVDPSQEVPSEVGENPESEAIGADLPVLERGNR